MPARLTEQEKLYRRMSEQELIDKTLQLAEMAGWWFHGNRPVWTPKGFKTPLRGMAGFPDYTFARTTGRIAAPARVFTEDSPLPMPLDSFAWAGQLLIVEFKTELGGYGPGQEEWARRLEPTGAYRLWRPSSWPEIERTLIDGKNLQSLPAR